MTKKYCIQCGEQFYARADAQTCSSRCRQKNRRNRLKERDDGVGLVSSIILTLIILVAISVIATAKGHNAHSSITPAAPSVNSIDKLSLQINSLNERVTTLEGKTGAKGEQGPRGEQGPVGAYGQKGDKGDKGDTGQGISLTTVPDTMLSSNVTLQGNTFNGANGLVRLDGAGNLPALNASALTNINASNISSGTINDLLLSSNVTLQGNSFNGNAQLVKTTLTGELPSLSGANLSNLNASAISTGTVSDTRLSSNISLLNATQTATGNKIFTGTTMFRNAVDSASAFQIQDSTGTSTLLSADTRPSTNLLANSSLESSFSPWIGVGFLGPTGVLSVNNSNAFIGSGSMQIVTSTGSGGAAYQLNLSASTAYSFSVYVKGSTSFSSFEIGYQSNGSTNTCSTGLSVSSASWTRYSCTFTTNSSPNNTSVYVRDTSGSHTFYIDAVQLELGSVVTGYGTGGGALSANVSFTLKSASTGAFQVQSNTGIPIFSVDTLGSAVNVGGSMALKSTSMTAFQVQDASSTLIFSIDTTNKRIVSSIPDSPSTIGFTFSTANYLAPGAKLLSVQNNGVEKFYIDKDGNTTLSSGASLSLGGNGGTTGALTKWFTCTAATSSGDVVVIDTVNPGNMTTTNVANSPLVAGVVKTGSSAGGTCEVAISGVVQANVTKAAAVGIGDRLTTSTTTGQGNTNNAPAVSTVYAKSLSSKGAGIIGPVWVILTPQ